MVLNRKDYFSFGDPRIWDKQLSSNFTPELQKQQFIEGRRVLELIKMEQGFGLRSQSFFLFKELHLYEETIEYYVQNIGKSEAIQLGIDWASRDPKKREFIAKKDFFKNITIQKGTTRDPLEVIVEYRKDLR